MNKKLQEELFGTVLRAARARGASAATAVTPVPMVVQEHANVMDDSSPVAQSWFVADGVCGFAWVIINPGTSAFARWLIKHGHAKPHYCGGVSIWISDYNQCHQKKVAHAAEMASYLRSVGISAHAGDRLD
jgi:hypothetical protein